MTTFWFNSDFFRNLLEYHSETAERVSMINQILFFIFIFLSHFSFLYAQETMGVAPAQVVVAEVSQGMIAPEAEFVGTVFYQEVSEVAAEVNGKVEEVLFEEGEKIKKGAILARLDSELLEKTVEATKASHEQVLADLEVAVRELKRMENLYKEGFIAEQAIDEIRFKVKGLEKRADAMKAEIAGLEAELKRKIIAAPFDGVVIKKHIDRGEWLSPGGTVATIARNKVVDIIVNVPEEVVRFIRTGMGVQVFSGGNRLSGTISAIVPQGDIQTRTFPVKIQVKRNIPLIEGMEAKASLPIGEKKKALMVPRDALVSRFGNTIVFAVIESQAKMIPVNVVGYAGMRAGVESPMLKQGMKVVIKGNERLMDGQPVSAK